MMGVAVGLQVDLQKSPPGVLPAHNRCLTVWHFIGAQLLPTVWSRLKPQWTELELAGFWSPGCGVGRTGPRCSPTHLFICIYLEGVDYIIPLHQRVMQQPP